jgi:DNA-binding winged helix-turn-helix (wHTH) protein
METKHFYEFGPFRIDPGQKLLMREGKVVPVTPKVFETLIVLIEKRGQVVQKEELMNRLWPDTFVEEGNLTYNISTLRKALGESLDGCPYIETIPKRGYCFRAEVKLRQEEAPAWLTREHSEVSSGKTVAAEGHHQLGHSIPAAVAAPKHPWAKLVRLRPWSFALAGGIFALLVILAALKLSSLRQRPSGHTSVEPSIAVLPFINLSLESDQEYFSDGLTHE